MGQSHDILLTMVTAVAAGIGLILVARAANLPAIVLLLAGGIALGPEGIGWVQPAILGDGLLVIVSVSIGLILFEGGLTLDVDGYRSSSTMIRRLLSIGVLTTWLASAAALWLVAGQPVSGAIAAGSLVIVTGPTVIAPLLRRIKIDVRLHSILHWEAVLIDPIGVFIALLCFEWIVSGETGTAAFANLGLRIVSGLGIGLLCGLGFTILVKRTIIPKEMLNVSAVGVALLAFGLAEWVESEAGLLASTAAGFVIGLSGVAKLKQLRQFKAELTDMLLGTLFILLAARLEVDQFKSFGWRGYAAVAVVIFLVRPLVIAVCSWGVGLSVREKVFLSWIAPRGIVAASVASLFAISMERVGTDGDPRLVETFTYSVIAGTIVLQGLTAGPLSRVLRLQRTDLTGWLIVGAHAFGRALARFITRAGRETVVLVDTNARTIRAARREGINALVVDARDPAIADRHQLHAIGNVISCTDNEDLNVRICQIWSEVVGEDHVFRCDTRAGDTSETMIDDPSTGRVVWPSLPKPSVLAAELDRNEATIFESSEAGAGLADLATRLVAIVKNNVVLDPEPAESDEGAPSAALYVERQGDYLLRAVRPELIQRLDVSTTRELFDRLLTPVVTLHPRLSKQSILDELIELDETFPAALGSGIAVPHVFCDELDRRVCAVAQVPDGMDFRAPDDQPVQLIFLLLSPKGDPEGHLATLAEIARLVVDPEVRHRLIEAPSPIGMMRIMNEARRR